MPLFTPGFTQHLKELGSLAKLDPRLIQQILKRLQGKSEPELQVELRSIFNTLAEMLAKHRMKAAVQKKLRDIFNFVASTDAALRKRVADIRDDDTKAFLEFLRNAEFANRCARLIALATQEQLQDIINHTSDAFTERSKGRANHESFSDWGQFGVMLVELISELFKIVAVQRGLDMSAFMPSADHSTASSSSSLEKGDRSNPLVNQLLNTARMRTI